MEICALVKEELDICRRQFVWIEKREIMEDRTNQMLILTNGVNVLLWNYMMTREDEIMILLRWFQVSNAVEMRLIYKVSTLTLKSIREWEMMFEWERALVHVKWHIFLFKQGKWFKNLMCRERREILPTVWLMYEIEITSSWYTLLCRESELTFSSCGSFLLCYWPFNRPKTIFRNHISTRII